MSWKGVKGSFDLSSAMGRLGRRDGHCLEKVNLLAVEVHPFFWLKAWLSRTELLLAQGLCGVWTYSSHSSSPRPCSLELFCVPGFYPWVWVFPGDGSVKSLVVWPLCLPQSWQGEWVVGMSSLLRPQDFLGFPRVGWIRVNFNLFSSLDLELSKP